MGCCGDKRKAWMEENRQSATADVSDSASVAPEAQKPDRVFEYSGNGAIRIDGAVTGKSYFFRFPGDKVVVDYVDAFAMMAEGDLRLVS